MGDDPIARLRAEMDQAKEGLKEYAASLWAFYSSLIEQGFTSAQALTLTQTFLAQAFSGQSGDGE